MRVITAIAEHPRKRGRFELELDGDSAATLSLEAIDRLHLAVGRQVDEKLEVQIEREGQLVATFDRAANMLEHRARSATELSRMLIRKGEPADAVAAAIEKLRAIGILDDSQFARQFARAKGVGAGLSRRRIQQELTRRGVARDIADGAIETTFVEEAIDEEKAIEDVARKRLRVLSRLDGATRERRLFAFLARRGYDASAIRDVVRRLTRETGGEDELVEV